MFHLVDATNVMEYLFNMQMDSIFPKIYKIYSLVLTISPTSVQCERIFSKLKLTKTYLRSTMHQERLEDLIIMSVERKILDELTDEEVINEFNRKKN